MTQIFAPPSPQSFHWEAQELRQIIIEKLAYAMMIGSGVAWTTVGAIGRFHRPRFELLVLLFGVSVALLVLNRYFRWATRVLLLTGPTICLMLALQRLDHPLVPAFASLIVVANAIASPWLGIASAGISSLILYRFAPPEVLVASLILAWASVVLQMIITQGLYTALKWASASQQRAADLLTEARDRRGELRGTLDSLTEATRRLERTRYELAIARQQAEESRHIKAQFAANISHELRTPLNLMIGFSEMMYRTPEVYGQVKWTPALRADIREIYSSARHLMGMVDDILDLARVEADRLPLRLEQTNIRDLVIEATETTSSLARGKPIETVVQVATDLPLILVDRARIRQVIINLVNNAIRFTDQGTLTISAEQEGDHLAIAVQDTGVGIPEDQLDVIFEEFGQATGPITSGRGGVGLGLAICQQFVRLHGGNISAKSEVGVGSVFRFTLPLGESGAQSRISFYAPEQWSPLVPENPMGKSAILITPDQSSTSVAREIEGYRTLPIAELTTLPELVESEHPAGIVILRDPFLPETTGAEQVWQAAGRRDLPVVACDVPMNRLAQQTLGIDATLNKPVRAEDIVQIVQAVASDASSFLVVDDDAGFVALMARLLTTAFPRSHIFRAYGGQEATEMLQANAFDMVFLDLMIPGANGMQLLRDWRRDQLLGSASVILTTGAGYEEEATLLRPTRIELVRNEAYGQIGRYISALLDVAPPNYSRPKASALSQSAKSAPAPDAPLTKALVDQ